MTDIGFDYLEGDSTFYIMVRLNVSDVFDFCLKLLLLDNISIVPGVAYGDSTKSYFRLSIGAESIDEIKRALLIIKDREKNSWQCNTSVNSILNDLGLKPYK